MDISLVTNATKLGGWENDHLCMSVMQCRWIAISVDAGDRETYEKVKGRDVFDKVIENISCLAERRRYIHKVDLCFKFLILPENVQSMHRACKLAKSIGVQDFHARPVDFERSDIAGHKKLDFNKELIEEQFALCHEEETEDFHVYTITHKFDEDFHIKHDFTRCFPTLIMPLLSDGNVYLCVDKKMEAKYRIGSAYPNPEQILEWWGSDAHRKLIKNVNINNCSRCTGSQYNAQIENTVIKDGMCLSFP